MTKIKIKKRCSKFSGIILLIGIIFIGTALSSVMAELVKAGLALAVKCVIPSAFPFMIISEYYIFYGAPENIGIARKVFKGIFGTSENALGAYIVGNICGFPLGARILCEEYSLGNLDKSECERLLAYCENPSVAFVVGAVGTGMLGSLKVGIVLLILIQLSTVICGVIYRERASGSVKRNIHTRKKPVFVESVKASGRSCLDIASFITAFSVICGLIKKALGNGLISGIIISITEITNSLSYFSEAMTLPSMLRFFFIGFSLGFGGICVMMQTAIFSSRQGLSLLPYLKIKLTQGLICGIMLMLAKGIYLF